MFIRIRTKDQIKGSRLIVREPNNKYASERNGMFNRMREVNSLAADNIRTVIIVEEEFNVLHVAPLHGAGLK